MARRHASSLAWLFPLLLLAGCAPGNPGLVILNVVAPSETCTYSTANTALLGGALDLSGGSGYSVALRYGNQLLNLGETGGNGPPRADPNVIQVQTVEVELQDVAGNPIALAGLPNPFTVPGGGGLVPSGDGSAFGEAIGVVEVIPRAYVGALAGSEGSILISMRAVGRTLGDAEVVSFPYSHIVQLCTGCLFGCPMDADMMPICIASCTPGQDDFQTDCIPGCTPGG